jgi:hypothetical protein
MLLSSTAANMDARMAVALGQPLSKPNWPSNWLTWSKSPYFGILLDLKKAFYAMDQDCCLLVLEGYGAGPNMRWLICHFWDKAQTVCRTSGNCGVSFKAGQGMTQGGPLSAKLFNLLVDAVA